MFIDTHAHLQWHSFDKDRNQVLQRAEKNNITHIINIGINLETSLKSIELAKNHSTIYATVGVHPHESHRVNAKTIETLKNLSKEKKVVAIGEIGLDYYRKLSPKDMQKQAFEKQLSLAQELNLPVVIHNREAHQDIYQILTKYQGKIKGIMHCFSGDLELAKQCINLGFLISFAGPITYPNAKKLQEVAKYIDTKHILLETDCPFLAPQDMRGKRNEPSFLPSIAQKIAELKKTNTTDIAKTTTENAKQIFKI